MQEYMDANRALWDAWTDLHEQSEFYDVEGFLAGKSRLKPIEQAELGDVTGRSLLHLQCHFGLDTLSWSRAGARAVGVDFSERAITLARTLNEKAGLQARFICSNVYDLPQNLTEKFDIVFTSYGVLPWLPDLKRWAETAAGFLQKGGTFYLVEFHPFAYIFDNEPGASDWRIVEPYFHRAEPQKYESQGSYAAPGADVRMSEYEWCHSLSDVLNALLAAGLRLEYVHEFPFSTYQQFPFLEKRGQWQWYPPEGKGDVPLLFSVKATKD